MSTAAERIEKAKDFLREIGEKIDVEIVYHVDWDEEEPSNWNESFEELETLLNDGDAFNQEVIYYQSAMEYLKANDDSLIESLSLASDMGYSLDNLNSEILASLLKTQNTREDWEECKSEIEDFFEELQEEKEEEEEEEEEETNE